MSPSSARTTARWDKSADAFRPSTDDRFSFRAGAGEPGGDWEGYCRLYAAGGDAFQETEDFRADITAIRLDRVILFDRRLRGLRHERRREHVVANGFDHFTLHLNLGGSAEVDSGEGFETLGEGEAVLLDTRLPMRLRLVDVHLLTASVARTLVVAAVADAAHGRRIDPEQTAPLRRRLAERAEGDPVGLALEGPRLLLMMLDMLGLEERPQPGADRLRRKVIRRAVIRDYVEANLARRELDPSEIASACAVSRATLYRLTEPDGGVSSFVRKVRLARLERLLADGVGEHLADLAERLGFADESHMSRQFRAVAGVSPGRYRTASREDLAANAARRRWSAWMAEFR